MAHGLLSGRTALITGASRGIGVAIASRFAAEGAAVAVTARSVSPDAPRPGGPQSGPPPSPGRLPGTITGTVDAIRAAGGTAVAIPGDLSRAEDRERLAAEAVAALGPIDILVNNAAVTYFTPVTDFTDRRMRLMFEVQVYAPVHLAQLLVPGMVAGGQGWILNVSSGAARHPQPESPLAARGGTVYGMCKAALERFSTGLAAELYRSNVAVNALSPNRVVPTPGTVHHHLVRPDDPAQVVEPPEVMAAAALALCSRPPRELTGRIAYSQDLLGELGLPVPVSTS